MTCVTSSSNSSQPPILRLPPELRLHIYALAIPNHWDPYPRIYTGFLDKLPEPPCLRACRKFRAEGMDTFLNFLQAKEAELVKSTMLIQGKEVSLRELVGKCADDAEEIGWWVMNRLWIEKEVLPDVRRELGRLRGLGYGSGLV